MYLGDRDLFVAAAVFTVAALAAASPDEYFRRAEDVKADPKLPPGEVFNFNSPISHLNLRFSVVICHNC